ncbi:hypothetical protein GGI02_002656 [Coemansia sp. RSA 2322]|uniref:AB hydrolase-1 domain-containing protein n=1 Tax=Coemansia thaxteri TaxID=2663907 RepID=A0A9W8EJE5_9FUNG|nr:hypothetical protein H4R26_002556 [Coemansia thaxteri]KAJ2470848.1 hypothetical protein GGI02_002656 [Coemansia sp. RSA 2322]KAJ2484388.1 hypothetical protein EV174_002469 [Coemansia sp. RSA 2320]
MAPNSLLATGIVVAGAMAVLRKRTVDGSDVRLLHAPKTAQVDGELTLLDIVQAECPSLADPAVARFVPSMALPSADLQTCFNAMREQFGKPSLVKYERELISTEDSGTIGLDWSPPFAQMPEDDRPIVLLSHGLSGGSQETYVQSTAKHLTSAPYSFRVVVVNFRGCAGVKLTTPVLYNGGLTSDYGIAVDHVRRRFPHSKLVGVGFSLGANMLTKYVGEQGERCALHAAVSVCNPYDLAASSDALEAPTFRNTRIYTPAMLLGLMNLFRRHRKVIEAGPVELDVQAIDKISRIREFDDLITAKLFGYRDSADYYHQNSCAQFMPKIRVPFLAISAMDDPVCPEDIIPRETFATNPHLMLALTQYGGHLGYHEDLASSWFVRPIAEFSAAIFRHTLA